MNELIGEFVGTAILITLGVGVVANVILAKTKGHNSGWIVITFGWAIAVFVGVFASTKIGSGGHLNAAITPKVGATTRIPSLSPSLFREEGTGMGSPR